MKPTRWNLKRFAFYGAFAGVFIGLFNEQDSILKGGNASAFAIGSILGSALRA
jgi:disulfide bond formation protein DsbB